MAKVTILMSLDGVDLTLDTELHAVPRRGEEVLVTGDEIGGWSETVKAVWHDVVSKTTTVELLDTWSANGKNRAGLLRKAGWRAACRS